MTDPNAVSRVEVDPDPDLCVAGPRRGRFLLAVAGISVVFLLLGARLFQHQILEHDRYLKRANKLHRSREVITAYRGDIELGDGVLVARDVLAYEVGLDPSKVSEENLPETVRIVCDALGKTADYRRRRIRTALRFQEAEKTYVHLADRADEEPVQQIRSALKDLLPHEQRRAFVVRRRNWRTYPRATLASAVVGVANAAGAGVQGVEAAMESYLSPREGAREFLRDASGRQRKMYRFSHFYLPSVSAYTVELTIDSRVQAIAERALEAGVREDRAESGLLVVMDCNNGDVLAMASYPPYDPNRFGEYPAAERERRRKNGVIEKLYEPGSVIKPFVWSVALERGVARRDARVKGYAGEEVTWDGGTMARFGSRVVRDTHEHEDMTVDDALVYSSNIGMAILGLQLGSAGLIDVLDRFGFCRPTGVGLPGEAKGRHTPPSQWKPLYSSVSVSFGYELLVSPIQLCRAFASLVNGGFLLKPRVIAGVRRDGVEEVFPGRTVVGRPISESTSKQMRAVLREVIQRGTGKFLKLEGFDFGGKTGTARMLQGGNYNRADYLASFEAFAPYENPQIVVLCMVEKPRTRLYYGSWVAGPIVVEVLRQLFDVKAEPLVKGYKKSA